MSTPEQPPKSSDPAPKPGKRRRAAKVLASGALSVRLPAELASEVEQAAQKAGMTPSDYTRLALRSAVDRGSAAVELREIEQRQAAQFEKMARRMNQLHQVQQFHLAVTDLFIRQMDALLPDYPDDASRTAGAAHGKRRYEALIRAVPGALSSGLAAKVKAALSETEGEGDGE